MAYYTLIEDRERALGSEAPMLGMPLPCVGFASYQLSFTVSHRLPFYD